MYNERIILLHVKLKLPCQFEMCPSWISQLFLMFKYILPFFYFQQLWAFFLLILLHPIHSKYKNTSKYQVIYKFSFFFILWLVYHDHFAASWNIFMWLYIFRSVITNLHFVSKEMRCVAFIYLQQQRYYIWYFVKAASIVPCGLVICQGTMHGGIHPLSCLFTSSMYFTL